MLTLLEFKDKSSSKYLGLNYSDVTMKKLRSWAKAQQFDLTKTFSGKTIKEEDFDFHITLTVTKSRHLLENGVFDIEPIKVEPVSFIYLGDRILTMKVRSAKLLNFRAGLMKEHKFIDRFPTYIPHTSVTYNKTKIFDLSKLELPSFDLIVDKLVIEDFIDVSAQTT